MERRQVLLAFGAEVVLTPGPKGMKGAIAMANEMRDEDSQCGSSCSSSTNPANPKIHRDTTGPEIWNDTDGKIDILVSGVGTGGTLTGVGEYIKPKKASFKIVAVEPADIACALRRQAGSAEDTGNRRRFHPADSRHQAD